MVCFKSEGSNAVEQYDSQRLCKNTSILAQGMLRIEGQRKLRLYAGVYSAVEIGWNAVGWLVFLFLLS